MRKPRIIFDREPAVVSHSRAWIKWPNSLANTTIKRNDGSSPIYEVLLTLLLTLRLDQLDARVRSISTLNSPDAAVRIALHLERVVRRAVANFGRPIDHDQ